MPFTDQKFESLRNQLNQAGIKSAAVVDDAFDPPTVSTLRGEVETFWNFVEREERVREQLTSCGVVVNSGDEISDGAIKILWDKRADSSELSNCANRTLFVGAGAAYDEVDRICESLTDLGLIVERVGQGDPDTPPEADLVFMDYFLGEHASDQSVERSAHMANAIYNKPQDIGCKPFLVLMSSSPVNASKAEEFREKSKLLGGMFDFASKDELRNATKFTLRLASWSLNLPHRHKIQRFIDSIESTLSERSRDFMQVAKSLTIEDYAFAQSLKLQNDGQPLGDYVQWLLSSLLTYKVFEDNSEFAASKRVIDEISLKPQPMSHLFPSAYLAEIYSRAIAELDLDDIGPHPKSSTDGIFGARSPDHGGDGDSRRQEEASNTPMLRLGDLLIHCGEQKTVYMIATPDCDLQFAPGTNRIHEGGETVLLVPGQLTALGEPRIASQIETDLFVHKGEKYRIVWDRKRTTTVSIGEFSDWCSSRGYSRSARIRLPYALKIQQEVFSAFGRVGMPVAPPLQEFLTVEIFSDDANGSLEALGQPIPSGVTVIHGRGSSASFFISRPIFDAIVDKSEYLCAKYAELAASANGARKTQLKSKLNRLNQIYKDPMKFAQIMVKGHTLPKQGQVCKLLDNTIVLHRNSSFSSRCRTSHVVCLKIDYD